MAKKYKRITRRNKKTGEITYYYYEKKGKTTAGKATAREFYSERGAKKRKTLTKSEAEAYLKSKSASFEIIQEVLNDYEGDEIRDIKSKTFTKEGLEAILSKKTGDRAENFLRQLGYSFNDFENEFGFSEAFVRNAGFEDIGDGVYQLKGTSLLFVWDYDSGLRRK